MRNILVSKNYQVSDHSKWYNNRTHEHNLATNYDEMESIMTASALRNLTGLTEVRVHRGEAANIREVFVKHFTEIYQVWRGTRANILYADLDVVFTKPTNYFGITDKFSMFNYTDPTSTHCDHYNMSFPHFFNCGIRYYPRDMDPAVWDIGFDMLTNFDWDRWDSEQIIYNAMMWSQSEVLSDFWRPELAFQLLHPDAPDYNERFNIIDLSDACAVHVHGSRGSADRLAVMRQLAHEHTDDGGQ